MREWDKRSCRGSLTPRSPVCPAWREKRLVGVGAGGAQVLAADDDAGGTIESSDIGFHGQSFQFIDEYYIFCYNECPSSGGV